MREPHQQFASFFEFRRYVTQIILPLIFCFGAAGNAISLALLASKRLYGERRSCIERSSVAGLMALAGSDLAFCLVGVLVAGVGLIEQRSDNPVFMAATYFVAHRGAFFNTFLFTSTWLIVLVSFER